MTQGGIRNSACPKSFKTGAAPWVRASRVASPLLRSAPPSPLDMLHPCIYSIYTYLRQALLYHYCGHCIPVPGLWRGSRVRSFLCRESQVLSPPLQPCPRQADADAYNVISRDGLSEYWRKDRETGKEKGREGIQRERERERKNNNNTDSHTQYTKSFF